MARHQQRPRRPKRPAGFIAHVGDRLAKARRAIVPIPPPPSFESISAQHDGSMRGLLRAAGQDPEAPEVARFLKAHSQALRIYLNLPVSREP